MIKEINNLLGLNITLEDKDMPRYFNDYAKKFGFNVYKIEKDFLLTVLLIDFSKNRPELIFKGGTCLNKIYYDYYRLSEDLDFYIINDGGVKIRGHKLDEYKELFQTEKYSKLGLNYIPKPNGTKHHKNHQGCYSFRYKSCLDGSEQTIKIDIRIEKESLYEIQNKTILSVYEDNLGLESLFEGYSINTMNLKEIASEKIRASLTRIKPAIRDLFDIRYMREHGVDFESLRNSISLKIDQQRETLKDGEELYTIDKISIPDLKSAVETDLVPVLGGTEKKDYNYEKFDLEEILSFVKQFQK